MFTPYVPELQLTRALERNEAFWRGELEGGPLMWITCAPEGPAPTLPTVTPLERWTNVDYVVAAAEADLSRRAYLGDTLPVHIINLGPDIFSAWLGAEMTISPEHNTTWVKPFVEEWSEHGELTIDPTGKWWRLYCELTQASAEAGRGKWVTTYPDMHSGIDALSAIRGPENLSMDLLTEPEAIGRAMGQMTELWRWVMAEMDRIILPAGQGTANWAPGWSAGRFSVIGQNDYSCMISPKLFRAFCAADNETVIAESDCTLYHWDGPQALVHEETILGWRGLTSVQWVPGAGNPPHSQWIDLMRRIQAAGKPVQCMLMAGNEMEEIEILTRELDPDRLMIHAWAPTRAAGEALLQCAQRAAAKR
jgi:hypothetical protein